MLVITTPFSVGTYSGDGNEGLVFGNSSQTVVGITLRGNLNNGDTNSIVLVKCIRQNRFLASFNDFFSQISDISVDDCHAAGVTGASFINVGGGAFAIISNSGISIKNVAFTNNTARYGGALLVQDSTVVVSGCTFVSNVAVYWGGAVKTYASGVTIDSSLFMDNQCDGSLVDDPMFSVNTENVGGGGALHANQGSYLAVNSSQFIGNYAKVMAGAVCVSTMGSASFDNSVFDGNSVQGGDTCFNSANCKIRAGALTVSNTLTEISNTNFSNNIAITSDISKVIQRYISW